MNKLSPKEITLFERVELISRRSVELEKGAKPLVEIGDITNPIEIAMMEFEMGKIPYIIERRFPNGEIKSYEISY